MSLERFDEALKVLLELMQQVPKEAPIHIVIGKIYKKLGNVDKAL
jgi:lipopolysaccharide biosynthesis regulator YciM